VDFCSTAERAKLLPWRRIPCVNVSGRLARVPFASVLPDNEAVGRMAAEHLVELGMERLVCATLGDVHFAKLRAEGFVQAARAAGREVHVRSEHMDATGRFVSGLERPLGLFAVTDHRAREIIGSCLALGLRVPEDVAVVGVDNDELAGLEAGVPLSTVDPAGEAVGYEAAGVLHRMLRGRKVPAVTLVPPRGLIARASSDITVVDDPDLSHAQRFIRDHAQESPRVKEILAGLGVSRSALEKRFRARFGRTLHDEVVRVKLERARRLLTETGLAVSEVARRSGFSCRSRFFAEFGRRFGETPSAYRSRRRAP
jgi:LacI family transcriptional regulator